MTALLIAVFAASLQLAPQIPPAPFAASASFTTRPATQNDFTLQGKITTIAAGKITVSTEENIIFHVRYDDKTEVKKKDGSPGAASDLKVGLTIAIAGDLQESGEIAAKKIEIQSEAPAR